jgi:predicted RNA-binding protein associated with RNAse of E/G family
LSEAITLIKRTLKGETSWQYEGRLLRRLVPDNSVGDGGFLVEAYFNRDDTPFLNTVLKRGDRFVELFYTGRWYNIFEIHDRDDDAIKGWYCNVGFPAVEEGEGHISYVDLALDLWVTPEGEQHVLDEDEFAALELDEATRSHALAALRELRALFMHGGWELEQEHRPPRGVGGL